MKQDEMILEKPEPMVVINKFNLDYMEMNALFWVQGAHALNSRWQLNKKVITTLEKEKIPMAYSQMEIVMSKCGE